MKKNIHFTAPYLIQPQHPIIINLIGCGGTGSQVLTNLAKIDTSLKALGHPGLYVRVFDDDKISEANRGRQLFSEAEIGLYKSEALVFRINRFFGTNWKAIPHKFSAELYNTGDSIVGANIYISCVDTIDSRFEIAAILNEIEKHNRHTYYCPYYWLDCGNNLDTGQVILSTISKIKQPTSKIYEVIDCLPFVTAEFKNELQEQKKSESNIPSCSLAESLDKQDLFVNPFVANACCKILWKLFREGLTSIRGAFINLQEVRVQPLYIENPYSKKCKSIKSKKSKSTI